MFITGTFTQFVIGKALIIVLGIYISLMIVEGLKFKIASSYQWVSTTNSIMVTNKFFLHIEPSINILSVFVGHYLILSFTFMGFFVPFDKVLYQPFGAFLLVQNLHLTIAFFIVIIVSVP